jgi:hypothetical protein
MATEAWLAQAAERLWATTPGTPSFPRDPFRLARYGLRVVLVSLPRLRLSLVGAWLADRCLPAPGGLEGPDRALRGCLACPLGKAHVFLDADDPEDERGYTLAHELAHLWIELLAPLERATWHLGERGVAILEGRVAPTPVERCQALFHRLPLQPRCHLLERDMQRGMIDGGVLYAEKQADRLALELLAPGEEARRRLPARALWRDWLPAAAEQLAAGFGLPRRVAEGYARELAPAVGAAPSFRERIAGT